MTLEIIIIVCLILLGVGLIMAEIFLLPGITVAGFVGGILMITSIVYAFYYIGPTEGYITIATNAVVCCAAFIYLIKSNALDRIALKTDIDSKIDQTELHQLNIGDKGVTLSRLNPIGKAQFGELIVEAKSFTGEFIDTEEHVEIVKIDPNNVLVEPIALSDNSIKLNKPKY